MHGDDQRQSDHFPQPQDRRAMGDCSGGNGDMRIPFYAFYKCIGKNEHGIDTYAKTYVPAVQVSGYEKYFESQKDNHKNNWYVN